MPSRFASSARAPSPASSYHHWVIGSVSCVLHVATDSSGNARGSRGMKSSLRSQEGPCSRELEPGHRLADEGRDDSEVLGDHRARPAASSIARSTFSPRMR